MIHQPESSGSRSSVQRSGPRSYVPAASGSGSNGPSPHPASHSQRAPSSVVATNARWLVGAPPANASRSSTIASRRSTSKPSSRSSVSKMVLISKQ